MDSMVSITACQGEISAYPQGRRLRLYFLLILLSLAVILDSNPALHQEPVSSLYGG